MSGHGYRYGDIVSGHSRRDGAVGTKDLHDLGGGRALFVEYVTPAEEELLDRAVEADARSG